MNTIKSPRTLGASIIFVSLILVTPWVWQLCGSKVTVQRLDAKGKPVRTEAGPSTNTWTPMGGISKHFLHAVLVAEDARFYQHLGLDPKEIWHSYQTNKRHGRYVRGGSTITQQVVKMAFLSREKTLVRKIREAMGAVFLEMIMSKEDILTWYVNLTEFGGGVYGVKQAGWHYFRTRPALLTIEQSIHLALVIPSPNKWSVGLRKKNLTPFGERRFLHIVNTMWRQGYLTENQRLAAMQRANFGAPLSFLQKRVPEELDTTVDPRDDIEEENDNAATSAVPSLAPVPTVGVEIAPQVTVMPVESPVTSASPTVPASEPPGN